MQTIDNDILNLICGAGGPSTQPIDWVAQRELARIIEEINKRNTQTPVDANSGW